MEIHNNLDLLKNQILNARAQMLASATQEMELEAFFYWNSNTKQLLIYDGTQWVDATSQGIIYSEGTGITIGDDNSINVKIASTSQQGIVQFATDAEVTTGTSTNRVITPKQLKDSLPTKLSDLTDDTSTNPVDKADTLTGLTSTVAELNYVDGVTGPIQDQLDDKVDKLITKPTAGTYTKVIINTEGQVTSGETLSTSDIPNLPLSKISDVTASKDEVNILDGATLTTTELNYVDGVTSPIQTQLDNKISISEKGVANGVATLDDNGLVPSTQLPGFVDDVIEINTISATAPATCAKGDKYYNSTSAKIFTATATDTWGTTGKTPDTDAIYVTKDTNMSYRWSGSALVQIGADKLKGYTQILTGDGTTTQYTLNHNLGTREVIIEVYRNSAPYDKIYPEIQHTDTSSATIRFSPAPANGVSYKSVVLAIGT